MIDPCRLTAAVTRKFPRFGPNKTQEISRLIFEIAKRERQDYRRVLTSLEASEPFDGIKMVLLARRFPQASRKPRPAQFPLPKLSIQPQLRTSLHSPGPILPRQIFVERSVKAAPLVLRLKKKLPQASFREIESLKTYLRNKPHTLSDHNARRSIFFLVEEKGAALLPCPCSAGAIHCGYQILNLGFGCPLECTYCYLQGYSNVPGILIPANFEDILGKLKIPRRPVRMGTGQFTDSLLIDHLTEYSPRLIEFFRRYPKVTFEFKTKTANIDLILKTRPAPNIVIAWSMNPPGIIRRNEFFSASYHDRLLAARRCQQAGYRLAFHFDPLILTDDWRDGYREVFHEIFRVIDRRQVAWISVGTLRMTTRLKQIIENRFPANTILDGELVGGFDDKLRYDRDERINVYRAFREWQQEWAAAVPLYLCMEDAGVYKEVGLKHPPFV